MNQEHINKRIEQIRTEINELEKEIWISRGFGVDDKKKTDVNKNWRLKDGDLFTFKYSTEIYRYEQKTGFILAGHPDHKLHLLGCIGVMDDKSFQIKYSLFGVEYSAEFYFDNVTFID